MAMTLVRQYMYVCYHARYVCPCMHSKESQSILECIIRIIMQIGLASLTHNHLTTQSKPIPQYLPDCKINSGDEGVTHSSLDKSTNICF